MADVDVAITPGSGINIRAFQKLSGDYDQYVRAVFGTAKASLGNIPWTVTTTGLSNVVSADVTRVGIIMTSAANGILYVRFDATIPVPGTLLYDYFLNPGERWEVPHEFVQLAQSWVGAVTGGSLLAVATTCA